MNKKEGNKSMCILTRHHGYIH